MSFELAKEKAIKYIGIAKKTKFEVRTKLQKCGFENNIIDEAITYIAGLGYIDDNDYVDAYIRQCMRLLNYSIYEIKQKLLQKGINKCIIETKLQELYENKYELNVKQKLLLGKLKSMDEQKTKQYLYRRGFSINNYDY